MSIAIAKDFERLKETVRNNKAVSGYINENGFHVIQFSKKDRDALYNEVNSEIPNHEVFTPNDKLGYWVISESENLTVIEINDKRYTVKHNWSNYQSKIYAKVRGIYASKK